MGCGNSNSINSVENKERNTSVDQKANLVNQVNQSQQVKPSYQKSNIKIQATPLQSNSNQYNINYSNINQNTVKSNQNQNFSQVHKAKKEFEKNYLDNKERKNILEMIDKEKLQKLVLSCKKRTQMNLQEFLIYFKQVTNPLTNAEKAFALFYWMTQNISYDVQGYYSGNRKVDPESVYRRGLGVCSGYARLFEYIGTYIGLNIICIIGFAKGYGYNINDKISGTNHEWNIIELNDVCYQIDSTWGAGYLNDRTFLKEYNEFYFCPEPEKLIASHFPEDPQWQLITPSISVEEFAERNKFSTNFYKMFSKTDYIYNTIKVKKKIYLRFYKKTKKYEFTLDFYDESGNKIDDVKYTQKENEEYVDLILIFEHKGKYRAEVYAKAGSTKTFPWIARYIFESEEEWGNELFDFTMEDYDVMNKLGLEYMSHKDLTFKAKNYEKLSFKFKPDSKIAIKSIDLSFNTYEFLYNQIKYKINDRNLDIDVIFNKKGKYKITIYYYDSSLSKDDRDEEEINYYPIVESDAEEFKEFPEGEIENNHQELERHQQDHEINEPFEDALKKIKFKYISHPNQNIEVNRIEKFEFEFEKKFVDITVSWLPKYSDIVMINREENNRKVIYIGFNEKKKFNLIFKFSSFGNVKGQLVYNVEFKGKLDDFFKKPEYHDPGVFLFDPIFTNLHMEEEATLKFKSDVTDEIIIKNYMEEYKYQKNKDGIFEVKITPNIEMLFVSYKKNNTDTDDKPILSMVLKVEPKRFKW